MKLSVGPVRQRVAEAPIASKWNALVDRQNAKIKAMAAEIKVLRRDLPSRPRKEGKERESRLPRAPRTPWATRVVDPQFVPQQRICYNCGQTQATWRATAWSRKPLKRQRRRIC